MRLKSLEIHGFKSFPDKTKLDFHEGVTGIVGPNGCGKSNIVDAMRWVLGETSAKALRGGEMADVIFNGTDRRPALGMAEVTLTLSDCGELLDTDYDEVAIGRRVFRDGKGEYLINRQPCRLKDIQNLIMDTGIGRTSYSIMEQGKIDMLLSSKPEDRRAVFEEAAGITKYKTQKKEALRKLDYTEANLVRIRDVIAENERQIRSLSRQASKAKRYQTLYDDLKTLELHLNHKQWREIRAEKAELGTSIHALRLQQDGLEDDIEKRQAAMAASRVEYQEIEKRLGELQARLSNLENESSNARNRIEFNGERTHELSVLIRQNEDDIQQATGKLENQRADIDRTDREIESVRTRIEERRAEVEAREAETAAARDERETLHHTLREFEEERSRLTSRVASLEATIETHRRQVDSDGQRTEQLDDETGRIRESEDSRRTEAEELKERISEQRSSVEEFEENLAELEQKYHQAKRSASDMQDDLSNLHKLHAEKRSRLEVLERLVADGEGFEQGTRTVLAGPDDDDTWTDRVREPLSAHLQVEPEHADAIETALGRRLQATIVSDVAAARDILTRLREEDLGRASLIAETELAVDPPEPGGRAPLGALGWAADHVRADPEVENLLRRLLHDLVLVEDLDTAFRLREERPDVALVTLSGEFVTAEGIVHGGRTGEESVSVLRMQNEIRELRQVADSLEGEISSRQHRRNQLEERVDRFEELLQQARERLQQKKLASSSLEGQHALVERDLEQLRNKRESLEWERRDVEERRSRIAETLVTDETERDEANARVEALSAEAESATERLAEARAREEMLTEQVTEARTGLAVEEGTERNLREQREPMLTRQHELEESLERCRQEIADYRSRIERCESESAELNEKIRRWEAESETSREERAGILEEKEKYAARIEEGEQELTRKRREVQEVADQRGKEEVKTAQLDVNLESLERNCRDRYRTELEYFEPDSHALLAVLEEQESDRGASSRSRTSAANATPAEDDESAGTMPATESGDSGHPAGDEDAEVPDPAEPDWERVEELVTTLRTKVDSMGPVNLDAIEEYDELEEHYRFNSQQLQDLENSKGELIRMIARINRDTRQMFSETFEKVRRNFRDMFKELFGEKAKADLVLLDDDDPLECGIDIVAKPPGKKLQSISLLSGGERSMTAVALLFGIYMVKPSPFCVLDELDAPLDEANVTRFIKVLDRFIGGSQFAIVTHNKRTMSRADIMYGISMEEFGVSKTVGVRFSKGEGEDRAVGDDARNEATGDEAEDEAETPAGAPPAVTEA